MLINLIDRMENDGVDNNVHQWTILHVQSDQMSESSETAEFPTMLPTKYPTVDAPMLVTVLTLN